MKILSKSHKLFFRNLYCNFFRQINIMNELDLLEKLRSGAIRSKDLESITNDCSKAVEIRHKYYYEKFKVEGNYKEIPYENFDYEHIFGQCCEEVIGYVSIPVGLVSPILIDGKEHCIPMATTEGCLVASANRGAKAVNLAGGISTVMYDDKMTRSPVLSFDTIQHLIIVKNWIDSDEGFNEMKLLFDSTTNHGSLISIFSIPSGRYLHLRFSASTGEAMGMNIVSKGVHKCMKYLIDQFSFVKLTSISGNTCSDKKPAAINWILGRGKSVLAECRLSRTICLELLRTTPENLQSLCLAKNYSGSAHAGMSSGGYNAHAANVVAAIFAATGQDLAQVGESSNCLTMFECVPTSSGGQDLLVTVTMPSIELGTIGGGTRLHHQQACLDLMRLDVPNSAEHLARVIAATVLCSELSLMAALDTNDLVRAHLLLNRHSAATTTTSIKGSTSSLSSAQSDNGKQPPPLPCSAQSANGE